MRLCKFAGPALLFHNHDIKLVYQLFGHSLQRLALRLSAYMVILLHIQ